MPDPQPFLVVIHDVAPLFSEELEIIAAGLRELVGSTFACAVVPRWKGSHSWRDNRTLLNLVESSGECLLHGDTHHRQSNPGLISCLTGRSDEFGGLSASEVQQRVDDGRDYLFRETGIKVSGLLPPAWRLQVDATSLTDLDYVMRFGKLESCREADQVFPLATWSFDWGWLKPASWGGNLWGAARWKFCHMAIPCVAIHPVDVTRRWLPRILQLIRRLLDRGHQPTVPRQVLSEQVC